MNEQTKQGFSSPAKLGAAIGVIGFSFSTFLSGNGIYVSLQARACRTELVVNVCYAGCDRSIESAR